MLRDVKFESPLHQENEGHHKVENVKSLPVAWVAGVVSLDDVDSGGEEGQRGD